MAAKGLPKDSLFQKANGKQAAKSPSKQETVETPRQTYYVPEAIHSQVKHLAIDKKRKVSELVVEGIELVLKKYQKQG